MTDYDIARRLEEFEQAIHADGLPFNPESLWDTATELLRLNVSGQEFLVGVSIASMTRNPREGCRTSHRQIARRANSLKIMFSLAHDAGWERVFSVLGIEE